MTQKEIAEVFADLPTTIGKVRIARFGWIGRKLGIFKSMKLEIREQPSVKVELIGAELFDMIGSSEIDKLNQSDQINLLLKSNISPIVNIIGMAVCREDKMPSKELLQAIRSTFTMSQLEKAFYEVYRRLDLKPFFGIMGLSKCLQLNLFQEPEVLSQES